MNPTRIVALTCTVALAGLAVGLALERQACRKLHVENNALRSQLLKKGELSAENQRLSNLLSQMNAARARTIGTTNITASSGDRAELTRLRSEIEQLAQRSNEVETLRADTRATLAALQEKHDAHRADRTTSHNNKSTVGGSSFEVLAANYGTAGTNLDVAADLNDRIRNGSLKVVANNNVAGDPDFGQVKSLTVVYRSGGSVITNHFREGDVVILPPP